MMPNISRTKCMLLNVLTLVSASFFCSPFAISQIEDTTQVLIRVPEEVSWKVQTLKPKKGLFISFEKTSCSKIESQLENIDPKFVKRFFFKDILPANCELKMELAKKDLEFDVNSFADPKRIVIDVFLPTYKERRDEKTGLPTLRTEVVEQKSLRQAPEKIISSPSNSNTSETSKISQIKNPLKPVSVWKHNAGWDEFPVYIQPFFKEFESYASKKDNRQKKLLALLNSLKEADAYKLLQTSENRNESFYEKLVKAELNFGMGQVLLASTHYETILAQNADNSLLSDIAKIRAVDVLTLQMLIENTSEAKARIKDAVDKLSLQTNSMRLEKSLRSIFALSSNENAFAPKRNLAKLVGDGNEVIPTLPGNLKEDLTAKLAIALDSQKKFLARSILLKDFLVNADLNVFFLEKENIKSFFTEFAPLGSHPYYIELLHLYSKKSFDSLRSFSKTKQYEKLVELESSLHARVQAEISKDYVTAVDAAFAYWYARSFSKSANYFSKASELETTSVQKIRAKIMALMAKAKLLSSTKKSDRNSQTLKVLRLDDQQLSTELKNTNNEIQREIYLSIKDQVDSELQTPSNLKSTAFLSLGAWSAAFKSSLDAQNKPGSSFPTEEGFKPSSATVYLFKALSQRFSDVGLRDEKKAVQKMMQSLGSADLSSDLKAKKEWTKEVLGLAEDFRRQSQFAEAAKAYFDLGNEGQSEDFSKSESFYRSGVLYYRTSDKENARKAFEQAIKANDSKVYVELSQEKLEKISE